MEAACEDSFHCENSGDCIDRSQVCNFHTDCPLGEDEGFICGEVLFCLFLCNIAGETCGLIFQLVILENALLQLA